MHSDTFIQELDFFFYFCLFPHPTSPTCDSYPGILMKTVKIHVLALRGKIILPIYDDSNIY